MKHLKKTLALAMAVACVGCFAACGGDDEGGVPGENVVGVEVTAEEWAAAFAATTAATNLTVDAYATYEWKAAEGSDFEKGAQSGVVKIADGKMYTEYTNTESWSLTEDSGVDAGEESGTMKEYHYEEDGTWHELCWDSFSNEWTKEISYWFSAEDCSGMYVVGMIYETDYAAYTYNADKGAYVCETTTRWGDDVTYEIKIKDGKIAALKTTETGDDDGIGSETSAMSITYGNASVTVPTDITIAEDSGEE